MISNVELIAGPLPSLDGPVAMEDSDDAPPSSSPPITTPLVDAGQVNRALPQIAAPPTPPLPAQSRKQPPHQAEPKVKRPRKDADEVGYKCDECGFVRHRSKAAASCPFHVWMTKFPNVPRVGKESMGAAHCRTWPAVRHKFVADDGTSFMMPSANCKFEGNWFRFRHYCILLYFSV